MFETFLQKVYDMEGNFQLQFTAKIWSNDKSLYPASNQDTVQINSDY